MGDAQAGDLIILTEMEHHSNLVPWQMLAAERGLQLEFIPVTDEGLLDLDAYRSAACQIAAAGVVHAHVERAGNDHAGAGDHSTGPRGRGRDACWMARNPCRIWASMCRTLDVDFLAFSAHKMCGPTGIGVLYGKSKLLEAMPPFLGGGDMIREVKLRSFRPNSVPHKFEAGTPAIAEAVGLGAAVDYLEASWHDSRSPSMNTPSSSTRWSGSKRSRVCGFWVRRRIRGAAWLPSLLTASTRTMWRRSWIATALRCAPGTTAPSPCTNGLGIPASTRASFYLYSAKEEVDALIDGLYKVKKVFG